MIKSRRARHILWLTKPIRRGCGKYVVTLVPSATPKAEPTITIREKQTKLMLEISIPTLWRICTAKAMQRGDQTEKDIDLTKGTIETPFWPDMTQVGDVPFRRKIKGGEKN